MYIYIYVCVCVCVCINSRSVMSEKYSQFHGNQNVKFFESIILNRQECLFHIS
jgi:hypothetical protein